MALTAPSLGSPATNALGGISTGLDEFFRAAQGIMALQNSKREQTEKQGQELLSIFGKAAQGDPSLLGDPNFQQHVTNVLAHMGTPIAQGKDPQNEIASILGMPSLSETLAQPGVLGSIEETPAGPGRTAAASALLGRPLTATGEAEVQGLPQQFPPAQQAAVINRLEMGLSQAEAKTAQYNNPNILIDYVQRNEPMYEQIYGKDAAKAMLDTSIASKLAQMSPLQLSQLEKNKATTKYLGQRGIDLAATRQARIDELNSRSAAARQRANYTAAMTKEIPTRAKLWTKMADYYDGRSNNEQATAQMTREQAQHYASTGETDRDAVALIGDMSRIASTNAGVIKNLQKQLGIDQKALNNPLTPQSQKAALKTAIDAEQQTLTTYQGTYNEDLQTITQMRSQQFTPYSGATQPAPAAQPGTGQTVTIQGQTYTVGERVQGGDGKYYTVNADGSLTPQ